MKTTPKLISLNLIALLLIASTVGCTSQQISDTLAVAEAALTSTAAILQPVNPTLAAHLNSGGALLKSAYDTYEIYSKAPASEKATALGKVRTSISATQQNLAALLNATRIKNPELVGYVTAYVSVANVVLTLIANKLPKPPAGAQAAISGPILPLPPSGIKSPDQLKAWFNQEVAKADAVRAGAPR